MRKGKWTSQSRERETALDFISQCSREISVGCTKAFLSASVNCLCRVELSTI